MESERDVMTDGTYAIMCKEDGVISLPLAFGLYFMRCHSLPLMTCKRIVTLTTIQTRVRLKRIVEQAEMEHTSKKSSTRASEILLLLAFQLNTIRSLSQCTHSWIDSFSWISVTC